MNKNKQSRASEVCGTLQASCMMGVPEKRAERKVQKEYLKKCG